MATWTLWDRKRQYYEVNWENVKQVCHSFGHAAGTYKHTSFAKDVNPYFAGKTEHAYAAFNKSAAMSHKLSEASRIYRTEFFEPMIDGRVNDYRDLINRLCDLRRQARHYNDLVRKVFDKVDAFNRNSFNQIDRYIQISKITRDVSATALVVMAAPVSATAAAGSGAAGAGLLTTGAFVKGASKLTDAKQIDSGVVGEAVIEVACEMTVGAIGIGGTSTLGQAVIVAVFVQAPLETCKTVAGGGDLKQGAASGAVEVAAAVGGHGLEKALPIEAWYKSASTGDHLKAVTALTGQGVGADQSKKFAQELAKSEPDAGDGTKLKASPNLRHLTGAYLNTRSADRAYVVRNCIRPHR